jgi:dolichol-phosphate mannosyltransferase
MTTPSPLLSVVIPCHNEEKVIEGTVRAVVGELEASGIPYEIVCVDDHCTDGTRRALEALRTEDPRRRWVANERSPGFGLAVQSGLQAADGDAVVILMADASDDPKDVVAYYEKILEGYDCVFGTRWHPRTVVRDYPRHKLVLNRVVNKVLQMLFWIPYNDVTNAFKCYRREALRGLQPILSHHFNLTVELPLKAITRGYSWTVVPTNWYGRAKGISKLRLKEMGSRYLFIVLYVWIERALSRGDYHVSRREAARAPDVAANRPLPSA